jgi:hypothetical protein
VFARKAPIAEAAKDRDHFVEVDAEERDATANQLAGHFAMNREKQVFRDWKKALETDANARLSLD